MFRKIFPASGAKVDMNCGVAKPGNQTSSWWNFLLLMDWPTTLKPANCDKFWMWTLSIAVRSWCGRATPALKKVVNDGKSTTGPVLIRWSFSRSNKSRGLTPLVWRLELTGETWPLGTAKISIIPELEASTYRTNAEAGTHTYIRTSALPFQSGKNSCHQEMSSGNSSSNEMMWWFFDTFDTFFDTLTPSWTNLSCVLKMQRASTRFVTNPEDLIKHKICRPKQIFRNWKPSSSARNSFLSASETDNVIVFLQKAVSKNSIRVLWVSSHSKARPDNGSLMCNSWLSVCRFGRQHFRT